MVAHIKAEPAAPAPGADDDGAADFAALADRAAAVEGAAVPGAAAPAGPVVDPVQETRDLVEFACALLLPFVPDRYAERYGQAERDAIARSWVALAEKRGWNLADTLGRWGPELAFAGAVAGPVLPIVVAEFKARKAARQPAPAPAPATGQARPQPAPQPAAPS